MKCPGGSTWNGKNCIVKKTVTTTETAKVKTTTTSPTIKDSNTEEGDSQSSKDSAPKK